MPEVENIILKGGGRITKWPTIHSIWVVNPNLMAQALPNLEVFSSDYIMDSFSKRKLLDIRNYRLTRATDLNTNDDREGLLVTGWSLPIKCAERVLPNINSRQDDDSDSTSLSVPCRSSPINCAERVLANIESRKGEDRDSTSNSVPCGRSPIKSLEAALPNTNPREDDDSDSTSTLMSCRRSNEHEVGISRLNLQDVLIEEDSDSDDWFRVPVTAVNTKPRLPRKRRKRGPDYTFHDELKILKYIKQNNMHSKVRGVAMWKAMENDSILEERTWQSIKNHFLRSMLPKIRMYDILGTSDIERLT